jgi:hypothetical protein
LRDRPLSEQVQDYIDSEIKTSVLRFLFLVIKKNYWAYGKRDLKGLLLIRRQLTKDKNGAFESKANALK